jgi:hypothetical protein
VKSSDVATQKGKAGALPRKDSLEASLDAVPGDPDAEDDFASLEELVVKKEGIAAVPWCSEQRASSERALGVFLLASCECVAGEQGSASQRPRQCTQHVATAPLQWQAMLAQALKMVLEYSLSILSPQYNSLVNESPKAHASLLAPSDRLLGFNTRGGGQTYAIETRDGHWTRTCVCFLSRRHCGR